MRNKNEKRASNAHKQMINKASDELGIMPNDYDDNGRTEEESTLRNVMVRSSDTGAHEQNR